MGEIKYYTEEGLQKMRDELNFLMNVRRPEISRQIAEARDKGDLSENAEYDAAKDAQGMLEMKISKLQESIMNARIIDQSNQDISRVFILCKVRIRNLRNNAEMTYELVPENESNIKTGKISVNSPIAKGLLGKSVGDKVEVEVPAGKIPFEIIEISR